MPKKSSNILKATLAAEKKNRKPGGLKKETIRQAAADLARLQRSATTSISETAAVTNGRGRGGRGRQQRPPAAEPAELPAVDSAAPPPVQPQAVQPAVPRFFIFSGTFNGPVTLTFNGPVTFNFHQQLLINHQQLLINHQQNHHHHNHQ